MDTPRANSDDKGLHKDVPRSTTGDTSALKLLRNTQDSMMEQVSVMALTIERIERLEGYQSIVRELLKDCRVPLAAHGHSGLVKQIDRFITDTGAPGELHTTQAMAMLPNQKHPGPGCSCRDCLQTYPDASA